MFIFYGMCYIYIINHINLPKISSATAQGEKDQNRRKLKGAKVINTTSLIKSEKKRKG